MQIQIHQGNPKDESIDDTEVQANQKNASMDVHANTGTECIYREIQANPKAFGEEVQIKMKTVRNTFEDVEVEVQRHLEIFKFKSIIWHLKMFKFNSIIHEGDYHIVTILHAHLTTVYLQLRFFPNKHTNPKLLD
jgi:hypothetical protein